MLRGTKAKADSNTSQNTTNTWRAQQEKTTKEVSIAKKGSTKGVFLISLQLNLC